MIEVQKTKKSKEQSVFFFFFFLMEKKIIDYLNTTPSNTPKH